MSASWFAEIAGLPVIGVTGTRGKSTTTHMLHAILEKAGKKVLLGGNVRGVSNLALLPQMTPEHIALMELDSWQLQGFGEAHMSPHMAVFTTFFPDHLNYYKNDLQAYLADKANIFLYQKPEDMLILGSQCEGTILDAYKSKLTGKYEVWGESSLPKEWKLLIPGDHNRYDAALALGTARALGIDDATTRSALESFKGIPGRLELLREVNGVKFYNDTNSTTPEATLAALHALDDGSKNIVLIMGGADKNLDMNELLLEIPKRTKRPFMLAGTGTSRVLEWLPEASVYDSLQAAVEEAHRFASPGDIVLFSPAFASFGMFKNEYDRGDQFNAIVETL